MSFQLCRETMSLLLSPHLKPLTGWRSGVPAVRQDIMCSLRFAFLSIFGWNKSKSHGVLSSITIAAASLRQLILSHGSLMGNGRKTETLSEKGKYEVNWARNLPTNKLATVIFGCKNHTVVECFDKEIFGEKEIFGVRATLTWYKRLKISLNAA
ncbi:hypothetical protein ACS0TY_007386 [Phlomoides rotata]